MMQSLQTKQPWWHLHCCKLVSASRAALERRELDKTRRDKTRDERTSRRATRDRPRRAGQVGLGRARRLSAYVTSSAGGTLRRRKVPLLSIVALVGLQWQLQFEWQWQCQLSAAIAFPLDRIGLPLRCVKLRSQASWPAAARWPRRARSAQTAAPFMGLGVAGAL